MEGGFGSGLRAKLAGQEEEPRSPAEAIAAADPASPDIELLRAELSASLAREQDLRASLHEQVEVSGREVRLEQDVAGQAAALDRRAAALAATEAELEDRERQIAQRLAELDGALEEKERLATLEARISEREQMVDLKIQELKQADDQRAAEAKQWKEKVEDLTQREKELAHAEARIGTARAESEARHEKLIKALEESEQKAHKAEDVARSLEQKLTEREEKLAKAEQEATQGRVQLEAREQVLAKREAEIAAESGKSEDRLVAKARELDTREL